MRWLRGSLSRWRRRAEPARPDRVLRRLAIEPLEDRRLLATLDLDVQLYGDDGGSRGAPISYARVGETFFLSVTTEDQRLSGTPAGVIALPLDLQWRNDIIRYPSGSATPPRRPARSRCLLRPCRMRWSPPVSPCSGPSANSMSTTPSTRRPRKFSACAAPACRSGFGPGDWQGPSGSARPDEERVQPAAI